MTRRIVQMTSVHPPFDVRIFHKECRSLARAGFDVTLIAPHDGGDLARDGVLLRAIPLPKSRKERMTRTLGTIYRTAVDADAEIYQFHDPELLPVGMLLKLRGKKVIYDVHEDYSSNMRKQWIPPMLQSAASLGVKVCEGSMGSVCDRIVAATPKIASQFHPSRTVVVQNFPSKEEFAAVAGRPYGERKNIVLYLGYLADVRGLREMTSAIEIVNKRLHAELVLAGKMVQGAQSARYLASSHVREMGVLDRGRVADLLSQARIGICVYHPTPNYYHGQPTKLLEYLAAGLPVVASDFPFYRQVIESCDCGLLVDPLNPKQIADALLTLLRDPKRAEEMGKRGWNAVQERFNWEHESKQLVATYQSL